MANAYIFYGKAGSGKGTQAKLLTDKLISENRAIINAETGSMLRTFANEPGYIQQKTKETMAQGKLTPVFLASYTWANALITRFTGTEDIVFDGVARRIEEAPILDSAIEYLGFEKVFIFHIHISDETAIHRMQSRAQIAGSSARADDVDVAAAQARLDAYRTQVAPVIEYFKAHPVYQLVEIDGEVDPEHVFAQIAQVIT